MSSSCPRTLVAELCFPTSGSFSFDCGERERERAWMRKSTPDITSPNYTGFSYTVTPFTSSWPNLTTSKLVWLFDPSNCNIEDKDRRITVVTASNRFLLVNSWRSQRGCIRCGIWNWKRRPLAATRRHLPKAATCGHLRPFDRSGHLRSLAATCPLRPLAVTCGHLPSAATCGHLRPLALCGHLRSLGRFGRSLAPAATCGQSSVEWLQVAASDREQRNTLSLTTCHLADGLWSL